MTVDIRKITSIKSNDFITFDLDDLITHVADGQTAIIIKEGFNIHFINRDNKDKKIHKYHI